MDPVHPYSLIGGGKNGEVHSKTKVLERHHFLKVLPKDQHRFLNVDGHKIYYARIWGGELRERSKDEQPPNDPNLIRLIFIQGLAGTHVQWFPQLEFFASDPRFDIVTVDSRGVGFSGTPPGRWKTSDMAKDVNSLIEEMNWSQCHLFGFSLGGMIALEAAAHRPDFYKSVTLISTHAGGLLGTMLPPWGIAPFLRTFANIGNVTALDKGMELLHSTTYLDDDVEEVTEELQKVADEVLGSNDRITNRFATAYELILQARKYIESDLEGPEIRPEGTIRQIAAAITHYVGWDRLNFLRTSGISFLVMAGVQDNLVNYLNAILLADALNAPLILKEDSGHAVNLHYRREMNVAMLRHVKQAEAKKLVEGRRPLTARSGFPPGTHPWTTAGILLVPCYLLASRIFQKRGRRVLLTMALISLILRVTQGPLYRRSDFNDLV